MTAVLKAKRERPADGGVVWHAAQCVFECKGCGERIATCRPVANNPEQLAIRGELLAMEHAACWDYADAVHARLARCLRKELKRREAMKARVMKALDRICGV
jgi:hypothetical protein